MLFPPWLKPASLAQPRARGWNTRSGERLPRRSLKRPLTQRSPSLKNFNSRSRTSTASAWARAPLPWLHIAEEVASEAVARGFKRLAITGTRWLVDSKVYPDALTAQGLAYMRPTPEERDEINRIIMDELVREPRSPRRAYWSVYKLTHRAPSSRRAAGSRSTRTECPESVGTLSLPVGTHSGTASH